jgi:hypothetical protein
MKKYPYFLFLLVLFVPFSFAHAKGDFDYLTVKGPGITGELNVTNPALTADFFAFADFSKGEVSSPVDPGEGYQVVRVYVVKENDKPAPTPFDQLHYYPYTDYVFYDGLVGGSSEYDGKWYDANPAAEEPFRAALAERARLAWIPLVVVALLLAVFILAYYREPKTT